jgi:serine/threonine protein kinase
MAPELIARKTTDQRIDVFSFGVTCYQTLTGKLPWGAANSLEAMLRHLNEPPREPRMFNPHLDDDTASVLLRSLARNPNDRHQSMRELVDELRRLRGDETPLPAASE